MLKFDTAINRMAEVKVENMRFLISPTGVVRMIIQAMPDPGTQQPIGIYEFSPNGIELEVLKDEILPQIIKVRDRLIAEQELINKEMPTEQVVEASRCDGTEDTL